MKTLAGKTRILCWLSLCLLFVQQVLDVWLGQAPWIIWVAVLLPLLIFVPGMLQDNLRSFIWLCFVSLLYFMRLVERLFIDPRDPLAILGMVSVVVLFCSAMMYVRWRAQEVRQASAIEAGHGD